ncbi:hypothetical protein L596_013993 [Steinernema carpocapsae]|uniref:Cyclin-like domain-containing protein n=1 Tax=Steinernema carpocapsae TaxID=34508 RepID=A0A4U5NBB9_STECR|nr:hypothetical protein L596_013993 [Steinernema carpocapsae]
MAKETLRSINNVFDVGPFMDKLVIREESDLLCTEWLDQSPSSTFQRTTNRKPNVLRMRLKNGASKDSTAWNTTFIQDCQVQAERRNEHLLEKKLSVPGFLSVLPEIDKTVHLDNRCFESMLFAEKLTKPRNDFFEKIQTDINRTTRRQAVCWLYDVCKAEKCDPTIFPLAISYFDRFCSVHSLRKQDVQVLATTCLFVASKILAPKPLMASRLCYYTDGAVSVDNLMSWEMLAVHKLDWNLCTPTAMEFFDQFVMREPAIGNTDRVFCDCVHQMQKNVELATLLPSHQAALALLYVTARNNSKIDSKAKDIVFRSTSLDKNMVSFYTTIIDRLHQNNFSDERITETISAEIIFAHEAELENNVNSKQLRTFIRSPLRRRSLRVTPNRPYDICNTSTEHVPIYSKKLLASHDDSGISL